MKHTSHTTIAFSSSALDNSVTPSVPEYTTFKTSILLQGQILLSISLKVNNKSRPQIIDAQMTQQSLSLTA